jgi:transposase
VAMEAAPNRRSYIRLTVIRSLLMGLERSVVAKQFCRSDRVVRLWIEMFNTGGIDALTTKGRPGRVRRVKLERIRDLLVPVLENPSQAGELHWTGVKVHGWLKEQLGLEVGYSTTVRYLHELGYNLRVPRPWPERQNEEERNIFLDQLRTWQADPGVELWFADECGVEGDPRPRRRWSARGSRPKVPYLGDHIRANVIGAVCPATGECSMIFDGMSAPGYGSSPGRRLRVSIRAVFLFLPPWRPIGSWETARTRRASNKSGPRFPLPTNTGTSRIRLRRSSPLSTRSPRSATCSSPRSVGSSPLPSCEPHESVG